MFTPEDVRGFEAASNIINAILDRHGSDISLPAMSALCSALQDIRLAALYIGEEHNDARGM